MRRISRVVKVNNIYIGGENEIAIQSMTNTHTKDVDTTLAQIGQLHRAGCELVRLAVFDQADCDAFGEVADKSSLPVIADIHFNSAFALHCIKNGAAKIRINPANMPIDRLDRIIDLAGERNVAIRIGVNAGSPDSKYINLGKTQALLDSLFGYVKHFENRGFYNTVLSVKSSSVSETVELNRTLADMCDYPLHIGLTEAGVLQTGIVKNTLAISKLLEQGIGDTIRVSLTAHPVQEVRVARTILQNLGLCNNSIDFISCPMCGRCQIDLEHIAEQVYNYVADLKTPLRVAVMGCEVNGPGECADADIGLAGGARIGFFKKGKIYKTVDKKDAVELFLSEIDAMVNNA